MELPFCVVKSGVRLSLDAYEILDEKTPSLRGYDITAGPVRLSLSNADIGVLHQILHKSAFSKSPSTNRTDRTAAGLYADWYLNSLYGGAKTTEPSYIGQFQSFLSYSGVYYYWDGMPEIIYGNPDLQYSARFAACYPEFFTGTGDRQGDKQFEYYFAQYIYNADDYKSGFMNKREGTNWTERAAAYLGLAALGAPVLNDLYKDIAEFKEDDISDAALLYFAAALCVFGDETGAADLARIGEDPDELENVLMLFINTHVDPEAALEYAVAQGGKNKYVPDSLELIYFVKNYMPAGEGIHSSVSYTLDGANEETALTNYDYASFVLSRAQFENFNLTNTGGSTGVYINYFGSAENLDEEYNTIKITRGINGELTAGNIIEIAYTIELPQGTDIGGLTVTDRLPSNMRYQAQTVEDARSRRYSVNNTEKQFIDISVWRENNSQRTIKVSYLAIITGAGEYIFEPAYIRAQWGGDNWGKTERILLNCKNFSENT